MPLTAFEHLIFALLPCCKHTWKRLGLPACLPLVLCPHACACLCLACLCILPEPVTCWDLLPPALCPVPILFIVICTCLCCDLYPCILHTGPVHLPATWDLVVLLTPPVPVLPLPMNHPNPWHATMCACLLYPYLLCSLPLLPATHLGQGWTMPSPCLWPAEYLVAWLCLCQVCLTFTYVDLAALQACLLSHLNAFYCWL